MAILGRGQPAKAIIVTAQGVQVVGTQAIVVTAPVDRRFKRVAVPKIGFGPGVPVSGDPRIVVVAAARDKQFARVYPATIGKGSAPAQPDVSPYSVTVVDSPVPATWRRVNTPLVSQGPAEPVAGPPVIVAAPVDRRWMRVYPATVGQGVAEPVPGPIIVSTPRNPKALVSRPIIITGVFEPPAVPGSPGPSLIVRPGPDPHRVTKGPILVLGVPGVVPPVNPADITWCPGPIFTDWHAGELFTDWAAETPVTQWKAATVLEDC